MKKVLFAWELGAGLGHIIHIRSLARHFLAMECEVFVALRDLTHAGNVFSGMKIKFLQAPFKSGHRAHPIMTPLSFSQLLNNNGFSSATELEELVRPWQTLYELVRPDILLLDNCPIALVAARGLDCLKVTIGVGFSSPPPGEPFGVFTESTPVQQQQMLEDDKHILDNTNRVLETINSDTLVSLDQLFYQNIETCFLSLPEFDHFCAREKSLYYGPVLSKSGAKPKWPRKSGKKVYVYMKPFANIVQLFKLFSKFHFSFIVYTNDVPTDVLNLCVAPNITFLTEPLDLSLVCKQADLAIVNAGHTTLCQFVLAGVPVLMVPLQMEQQMLAVRMRQQNTGWIGDTERQGFLQNIENMLSSLRKGLPVQRNIRDKYAGSNYYLRQEKMCREIAEK